MLLRRLAALGAALLSLTASAERLPVVASFSLLADLTQAVGGEHIELKTLVGPDGDAHVYQPTPRDVQAVAKARVLVVNGLGFEGWIGRLRQASRFKGIEVVASQGLTPLAGDHHGHPHADPHAWQNPANVHRYVDNIATGLAQADPANATYYRQRAGDYRRRLSEFERWADAEMASIPLAKRQVITSHDAFAYLGQRFAIRFQAPQGRGTDSEASVQDVVKLIRQIRQSRIQAVFVENISNPRLLEQIGRETGVAPGGRLYSDALSTANGPAPDYLAMMRHNISQLVAGMRRN
ncbi:metal ABC transporter substrate-binding protein [Chitinimonas lacunae]|uniref:Metal ABC transporter substrate-binding protein n=1 Tax=Chitinimonas lacunae TaxID=1963018 RepID=A0ABV8MRJ4_9NEIS